MNDIVCKGDWTLAPERIAYHGFPRFRARWTTGMDALETLEGPCWTDGDDQAEPIHIYEIRWLDRAPDQSTFHKIMLQASLEIDAWVVDRL